MDQKIIKRLERIFKGAGNHSRIRILEYVSGSNETSIWAMSETLNLDFRLTSHHASVLEKAGLISKYHIGPSVYHEITPYGQIILDTIKKLSL